MRNSLVLLLSIAALGGAIAEAQQPAKVPRIGILSSGSAGSDLRHEAFRQGLRDLGYIEEKNIFIEYRWAEGKFDRLPDLAADLVGLKVDVIVTSDGFVIRAAKGATRTIPIVMTQSSDPVERGFVASLARPAGNITGLSFMSPELSGKRLELLKEASPRISRVAVLTTAPNPPIEGWFKQMDAASQASGVKLQILKVVDTNGIDSAFSAMIRERAGAFIVQPTPMLAQNQTRIVKLAAQNRLPGIYHRREAVEAGGLMSYGANLADLWRRAATYVDKILQGAKPADLPVEQPTKFELVINLKTAKTLGLKIPAHLLMEAGKVIE